jgi:hypothetical protein
MVLDLGDYSHALDRGAPPVMHHEKFEYPPPGDWGGGGPYDAALLTPGGAAGTG